MPCGNQMAGKAGVSATYPCRSCHIVSKSLAKVHSTPFEFSRWTKEEEIFIREYIKSKKFSPNRTTKELISYGLSENYSPLFFLKSLEIQQVNH